MNIKAQPRNQTLAATRNRQTHNLWLVMLLALLVLIALALTGGAASAHPGLTGDPSQVTISAFDRADNASVTPFRYIINEDTAHQAEDGNVPVFTNPHAYSPIVATGDETTGPVSLPPGKYLVSVIGGELPPISGDPASNSYKSSGAHFTVDGSGEAVAVEVGLVKGPLPTASVVVEVFHDNHMVNNARDYPVEDGLEGFSVLLEDGTGEVAVDIYGNPLCTEYDGVGSSTPAGDPVPGTGGLCLTDADGVVTIPNLGPLKYGAFVIPPDGSGWIQTSTIEGTPIIDVWVQEGNNGYLAEQGQLTALALFGFVQECEFGLCPELNNQGIPTPPNSPTPPQGSATIIGRIREAPEDVVGPLGPIVPEPYIALNNLSGNDEQVYTGRGNPDGTFSIPNVPPGLYQVVIWDRPLDIIIQFVTVSVGPEDQGGIVDMGDIGVPRWFGVIEGYVYWDNGYDASGNMITGIPSGFEGPDGAVPGAENGFRDCQPNATGPHDVAKCEDGVAGQDLDIRFKDGSIKYAAFTDANGYYSFEEVFPFPAFTIWEVGFGRFKQVGTMAYFTEPTPDGSPNTPVGYPYNPENMPGCPRDANGDRDPGCDPADAFGPASLLQGALTSAGRYHWIDTGKLPYPADENGGIAGLVVYAVTRNEFDPRIAAPEDYEPGVPNVTINLYPAALDANQPISCTEPGPGCPYGEGELMRGLAPGIDDGNPDTPIDSVETDSWDANLPTDCRYSDLIEPTPSIIQDPLCLEIFKNFAQLKDGVFDGGYAFEGVAPGAYIVEMEAPFGYRQIKEEDQNTDQGDDFIPQVPPPPCAGPLHLVNDERNPANGQMTPLCDSKFVRVVNGTNPPAEFYVMTDFDDSVDGNGGPVENFTGTTAVPPPGFIRGFMSDDLNVDFRPDSPNYRLKRGVPNTSIGILDFMDNEIAVVNTDEYGFFEVLLPSGDTIACPTPGGLCPSMYKVVGNYPGQDPLNPIETYNPNYATLTLPTDVWTGKTTYSDVAIVPITAFAGFEQQPICTVTGPDVQSVDTVYGPRGTSFNISGSGFSPTATAPSVTLGGAPLTVNPGWSDTAINVTIPTGNSVPTGPQQLVVTDANGVVSQTGITFHVIKTNNPQQYNPTILDVSAGQSIQDAVDLAMDGGNNRTLIVVHPGTYYENPIVYKNVKLQGFGPGATSIDGRFLGYGPGTGGTDADTWIAQVDGLNGGNGPVGPTEVPIGQVVTVVAAANNTHNNNQFPTQIDGFTIIGGSTFKVENRAPRATQGGGIYAHFRANRLQVSNNLIQSNGGNAGGGVILGQAYVGNNNNGNVRIHHNRILNNGGFILAGGIGIFTGANDYEIDHNQICGNYSAEYGGGISHFGMSTGGWIHHNEILFNSAFDEGGGVIIASELPDPGVVADGSGDVSIEANLIRQNVSNDDGGGIRLLAPIEGPVHILNNMVVNNLATDIGGGIALDDALAVEIINNTIAHNVSTATAEDADRSPTCAPNGGLETCAHAAGIASTGFSAALLDTNPPTTFSDPLMFNNIFWQNEAFHLDQFGFVVPDPAGARPGSIIDLEVLGTTIPQTMTPNYSVLTALYGSGVGNTTGDPLFADNSVFVNFEALPFVADPAFVTVQVTTSPADPQGDYHLTVGSSAIDLGMASFGGVDAPLLDIDGDTRDANPDSGADEYVP